MAKKFYHGTSMENWNKIQEEGVLFGVRQVLNNDGTVCTKYRPSRCTYLACDIEEAKCYGEVVLEVEYDVLKNRDKNNWAPDCWQVRVYEPIKTEKIKRIL